MLFKKKKEILQLFDGQLLDPAAIISRVYADAKNFDREYQKDYIATTLNAYQIDVPMTPAQKENRIIFSVGLGLILLVLAIILNLPNPTSPQYTIIRIILALAAGAFGSFIPGLLSIQIDESSGSGQRWKIRAAGALAIFLIVFFWDPAKGIY